MKALAFPWFVEKVRPICTRGSLKAVEAGEPDFDVFWCNGLQIVDIK